MIQLSLNSTFIDVGLEIWKDTMKKQQPWIITFHKFVQNVSWSLGTKTISNILKKILQKVVSIHTAQLSIEWDSNWANINFSIDRDFNQANKNARFLPRSILNRLGFLNWSLDRYSTNRPQKLIYAEYEICRNCSFFLSLFMLLILQPTYVYTFNVQSQRIIKKKKKLFRWVTL